MAYCRCGKDSDVYVYADIRGGYTLHVAWSRNGETAIGLPLDGKDYWNQTPEECIGRLEALRELGYNVPQYAIERLRSEVA